MNALYPHGPVQLSTVAGLLLQGTKQKTEGDAEYKAAQAKGYGEF